MLKKTIKFNDYNGQPREEDFYFNLTKAELMEMELGTTGGLSEIIKKIMMTQDTPSIVKLFKEMILKAYGVKSDDGRRFIKNDEVRNDFAQTEAYSNLFMTLSTNDEEAIKFIKGIVPSDLADQINDKDIKNNQLQEPKNTQENK